MSYDIVNLYPSIPINKSLDVLIDQLNYDKDDLIKRTKVCLKDIYELAELCLSKCYFLWNNEIRILKNSVKKLGTYWIIFYGCFIWKLHSEFGTQCHCRSIVKTQVKNEWGQVNTSRTRVNRNRIQVNKWIQVNKSKAQMNTT